MAGSLFMLEASSETERLLGELDVDPEGSDTTSVSASEPADQSSAGLFTNLQMFWSLPSWVCVCVSGCSPSSWPEASVPAHNHTTAEC